MRSAAKVLAAKSQEVAIRVSDPSVRPRGNSTASAYGEPVGKQAEGASAVLSLQDLEFSP